MNVFIQTELRDVEVTLSKEACIWSCKTDAWTRRIAFDTEIQSRSATSMILRQKGNQSKTLLCFFYTSTHCLSSFWVEMLLYDWSECILSLWPKKIPFITGGSHKNEQCVAAHRVLDQWLSPFFSCDPLKLSYVYLWALMHNANGLWATKLISPSQSLEL